MFLASDRVYEFMSLRWDLRDLRGSMGMLRL
jgi:hypothetical protein